MPPPSTTSSSCRPEGARVSSPDETSVKGWGLPVDEIPANEPRPSCWPEETTDSTKLFQAPQSVHLPSHFGAWQPQFWHSYIRFSFATYSPWGREGLTKSLLIDNRKPLDIGEQNPY